MSVRCNTLVLYVSLQCLRVAAELSCQMLDKRFSRTLYRVVFNDRRMTVATVVVCRNSRQKAVSNFTIRLNSTYISHGRRAGSVAASVSTVVLTDCIVTCQAGFEVVDSTRLGGCTHIHIPHADIPPHTYAHTIHSQSHVYDVFLALKQLTMIVIVMFVVLSSY